MTKKDIHSVDPKTCQGKAASSQNLVTHGLTSSRWLETNKQSLFNETVEVFNTTLIPQSSIEIVQ
jgi:hypothetical protein